MQGKLWLQGIFFSMFQLYWKGLMYSFLCYCLLPFKTKYYYISTYFKSTDICMWPCCIINFVLSLMQHRKERQTYIQTFIYSLSLKLVIAYFIAILICLKQVHTNLFLNIISSSFKYTSFPPKTPFNHHEQTFSY